MRDNPREALRDLEELDEAGRERVMSLFPQEELVQILRVALLERELAQEANIPTGSYNRCDLTY